MRAALWLLGLFAAAVAVVLLARLDQGYVIVVYPPWRLELSFILAVLLLAAVLGLGYFALRLAAIALDLSGDLRAWREKRRREKADQALLDALRAHLDGHPERARELAVQAEASTLAPDLADRLKRPSPSPLPLDNTAP